MLLSLLSRVLVSLLLAAQQGVADVASLDRIEYVDPLIGTIAGGHVFAGATLPFGMAKAVADVEGENQAGFSPDGTRVRGFSHMHDSGTGGVTSLGNFPLYPINCPGDNLKDCIHHRNVHYVNGSIQARPGYFALTLETGIRAEMTVSNHTALYHFKFEEPDKASEETTSPLITVSLSSLNGAANTPDLSHNNVTGRIKGSGTFIPSFGTGNYRLHFCADFSGATIRQTGFYSDGGQTDDVVGEKFYVPRGGFVRFNTPDKVNRTITARVGMSYISPEQACSSAEKEIPTFDFDATLRAAEEAWREKLSVISLSDDPDVSKELKKVFWSGISRNFHSPQDYTGENPLWESTEPYYDSFYCIWDSFRAQHPLLTLMDPHSQARMVRSLIDTYRNQGYLPDCRMSLCKGWTQGGSNADVVLADAFVKGMYDYSQYRIDWKTGYEAVVKDAEVEASRWDLEGRGGLESWKKLGYIPMDDDRDTAGFGPHTRSISRTVEYAYDDFAVSQIARGLGQTTFNISNETFEKYDGDWKKYTGRAGNWKNLLNVNQTTTMPDGRDSGFSGTLQPKFYNGSWAYQHPLLCSAILEPLACFLTMDGHETYEGSTWLYTFFTPADVAALIKMLGSREDFVKRLDFLHESGMLYMGDEQAFLTTFLYHYAGRPGLSAKRAHAYIPSQFNDTRVGIPGNDDSGAMGAFAALTMMGIFPNAGQNVYFITPPFFRQVSIRNRATGRVATIRNRNFDAGYRNIYVQSASLDGVPYTRSWIDHAFFLDGGVLELVLGPEESDWGSAEVDLPPSISSGGINNGTWDDGNPSRAVRANGSRSWPPWRYVVLVVLLVLTAAVGFLGFRRWEGARARSRGELYQRLSVDGGARDGFEETEAQGGFAGRAAGLVTSPQQRDEEEGQQEKGG